MFFEEEDMVGKSIGVASMWATLGYMASLLSKSTDPASGVIAFFGLLVLVAAMVVTKKILE
mgnify:CR=1 FL=1